MITFSALKGGWHFCVKYRHSCKGIDDTSRNAHKGASNLASNLKLPVGLLHGHDGVRFYYAKGHSSRFIQKVMQHLTLCGWVSFCLCHTVYTLSLNVKRFYLQFESCHWYS
ncbi:unnamed protein product, partial [Owenia fusiformis]